MVSSLQKNNPEIPPLLKRAPVKEKCEFVITIK